MNKIEVVNELSDGVWVHITLDTLENLTAEQLKQIVKDCICAARQHDEVKS